MRLRDEDGFTMVELLTAMAMSLVVLSATLVTFNTFLTNDATARQVNDAQDQARNAVDRVARQLRNLANPTGEESTTIDVAGGYDLVFQTSDPAKRRVRYCLAPAPGGAGERLWFQTTTATTSLTTAMTATCPGSGWASESSVAEHLVNRIAGADRRVFTYGCSNATPPGQSCTASSAVYEQVLSARVDLHLDVNGAERRPAATRLATAVYLRNQNERPTAAFTNTALAPLTLLFNGSGSQDPEGRTLRYQWFKGTAALPALPPPCGAGPDTPNTSATDPFLGEGVTLTHRFPGAGREEIRLRVIDPGCRNAVAGPVAVIIP